MKGLGFGVAWGFAALGLIGIAILRIVVGVLVIHVGVSVSLAKKKTLLFTQGYYLLIQPQELLAVHLNFVHLQKGFSSLDVSGAGS